MDQLKKDLQRSVALIGSLDQRAAVQSKVLNEKLEHPDMRVDALGIARDVKFLRDNSVAEAEFMIKSIVSMQRQIDSEVSRLTQLVWKDHKQLEDDENNGQVDVLAGLEFLSDNDVGDSEAETSLEQDVGELATSATVEEIAKAILNKELSVRSERPLEKADPTITTTTPEIFSSTIVSGKANDIAAEAITPGSALSTEPSESVESDNVINSDEVIKSTEVAEGPESVELTGRVEPEESARLMDVTGSTEPTEAIKAVESVEPIASKHEDDIATNSEKSVSDITTSAEPIANTVSKSLTNNVTNDVVRRRSTRLLKIAEEPQIAHPHNRATSDSSDQEFFTPPQSKDPSHENHTPDEVPNLRRSSRLHVETSTEISNSANGNVGPATSVEPSKPEQSSNPGVEAPVANTTTKPTLEGSPLAVRKGQLQAKLQKLGASSDFYNNYQETNKLSDLDALDALEKIDNLKQLNALLEGEKEDEGTNTSESVSSLPSARTRHRSTRSNQSHTTSAPVAQTKPAEELVQHLEASSKSSRTSRSNSKLKSQSEEQDQNQSKESEEDAVPSPPLPSTKSLSPPPSNRLRTSRRNQSTQSSLKHTLDEAEESTRSKKTKTTKASAQTKNISATSIATSKSSSTKPNVKAYAGIIQLASNHSDPNIYCLCQRPSFGRMIACDNTVDCPHEWFHLTCLGLKNVPKGTWFCPTCVKKYGKAPKLAQTKSKEGSA